jgi:hypothetical protein
MKYIVKFQVVQQATIFADSPADAAKWARLKFAQFPADTCKLLSIYREDCVDPPEPPAGPKDSKPFGKPPTGGPTGGTSNKVVPVADAIAKAA